MNGGGFSRFDSDGPHGVEPIGWQGSGLDWEVYSNERPMRAMAYDEDVLMAVVKSRSRLLLWLKMTAAARRVRRGVR